MSSFLSSPPLPSSLPAKASLLLLPTDFKYTAPGARRRMQTDMTSRQLRVYRAKKREMTEI